MKKLSNVFLIITSMVKISSSTCNSLSIGNSHQELNHFNDFWLVVDFDGTCTKRDTVSILHKIASSYSNDNEKDEIQRHETWGKLEREFLSRYNHVKESILSKGGQEKNLMELENALDLLDEVSDDVTPKVSASHVLSGIPTKTSDMSACIKSNFNFIAASKLQDNCVNTIATAIANGWNFGVLSINWSPSLIESALIQKIGDFFDKYSSPDFHFPKKSICNEELLKDHIWCNRIEENGEIQLIVPGAAQKREKLKKLQNINEIKKNFIVYIGDSATDLLSLIEADIGILVGRSQGAVDFAQKFGFQVLPLTQLKQNSKYCMSKDIIWLTNDWKEIDSLLRRLKQ